VKQETLASRSAPPSSEGALYPQLTFDSDALVLGAGVKLACVKGGSATPIDEPRLEVMLAVAYGRAISRLPLAHARRAVEKMRQGDVASALMHLALTGFGKFSQPKEAVWRLSAADGLLGSGVEPRMILRALALDSPPDASRTQKYSPDQPRVSAGNTGGGQWTSGSSQGPASSPQPARDAGVQVADASEDWAQYLMPSAETDQQTADIDASPQPVPQAPAKGLTIVHEVPPDAVSLTAGDGTSFYAPPDADFSKVYAAGQANWLDLIAAYLAVGTNGTYDFQRDNGTFFTSYTNASNYGVGVYMAGAGFSYDATITIGSVYAKYFSSNAGSLSHISWWTRGWNDATSGLGPFARP
jgi:hypothetical protein